MATLNIIKIGGNIIDNENALHNFLQQLAAIRQPKILIHGGGKLATELSEKLGIATTMVEGKRITDFETLKIVTMVYAGLINKTIVAKLQAFGCNAIGLSGADALCIPATKRTNAEIDYGYVGDPIHAQVNISFFTQQLNNGLTPIVAPITSTQQGQLLNTNADTIAQTLAVALSHEFTTRLFYCFEKPGVLQNPNDDNSVIHSINHSEFQNYKNTGIISKGMIPKLDNAFNAIANKVESVWIGHANSVYETIELGKTSGTLLQK